MRIVVGLALLSATCLIACGSSSKSGPSGGGGGSTGGDDTGSGGADSTPSKAGAGNHHPGGGAGNGDAGAGDGGDGGEAGAGEPPVVSVATPHTAGALVAGGTVAHSAHFTGIFSLGAAPGGNGLATSKSRQLRAGVLGASQK